MNMSGGGNYKLTNKFSPALHESLLDLDVELLRGEGVALKKTKWTRMFLKLTKYSTGITGIGSGEDDEKN